MFADHYFVDFISGAAGRLAIIGVVITPPRTCAVRGQVIGRGVYVYVCKKNLLLSEVYFNTDIGFSSNLMTSDTA